MIRFSRIDRECKQCANKSVPPRCCLAWASSVCFQGRGDDWQLFSEPEPGSDVSPWPIPVLFIAKSFPWRIKPKYHHRHFGSQAGKRGFVHLSIINQQFSSDWSLGPTRKMSEGKLFDVIPMSLKKVYLLMKIYHRELLWWGTISIKSADSKCQSSLSLYKSPKV